MNFWERLAWITIAVALVVFVVLMGIKIIRLEEDIEETAQYLEGEKTELHNEILNSFQKIEEKVDEDIAGLAQYLEGEKTELYEDIAGLAQYLEEEKTEIRNEILDNFYRIEEKVDEDIAGLAQYLEGEINNLYSNILNNYNMNKEYIDNKILVIEYLINRICEINGLELPAGYTPPEFEE